MFNDDVQLAILPVLFVTFSSTFSGTFLPELVSHSVGPYKVVRLIAPPRSGKSNRVRVCLTPEW